MHIKHSQRERGILIEIASRAQWGAYFLAEREMTNLRTRAGQRYPGSPESWIVGTKSECKTTAASASRRRLAYTMQMSWL